MLDLQQRSIDIIRAGQFDGAYAACLSFSQYGYSWLRDGTWIAYGMDAAGQTKSARAFHQWAARTVSRYTDKVDYLLAKMERGETPNERDYLPTRFELDGRIGAVDWPEFQLDGYGTWLWGLVEFVRSHHDNTLWQTSLPAVTLTTRYLTALWQYPSYDCWEEFRDHIHPATLSAVYGGLRAVQSIAPELVSPGLPDAIQRFVLEKAITPDGHFMKYLGNSAVDSSLLWIALPYQLVPVDDIRYQATVAKIERDIHRPGGGVYRYRSDTYYGGGEWLLLTLWLAWVYCTQGQLNQAHELVRWVESQASPSGEMPEQVAGHLLAPEYHDQWISRWGTSASPLLWSHGMYLLLKSLLKDRGC